MNKQEQVQQMTTYMANFVSHIAKVLPDDIIAKLDELGAQEDAPLSKVIYETMKRNQKLAKELNRPSCQDTGVLQFWVKCGVDFPLIGEVEGLLKEAVVKATLKHPCATTVLRLSMSSTPAATSAKAPLPSGGISSRTATSVRSTLIWQAAAAPCRARPWF